MTAGIHPVTWVRQQVCPFEGLQAGQSHSAPINPASRLPRQKDKRTIQAKRQATVGNGSRRREGK